MLSSDGGIRQIALYLKDAMVEQGWKVISPDVAADLEKKDITYLPQYDQTINKEIKTDYASLSSSEQSNLLEVEVI